MKWYKLPEEGMLGGVCAGLADSLEWDLFWTRILVLFLIGSSAGFVFLYLVFWLTFPTKEEFENK